MAPFHGKGIEMQYRLKIVFVDGQELVLEDRKSVV